MRTVNTFRPNKRPGYERKEDLMEHAKNVCEKMHGLAVLDEKYAIVDLSRYEVKEKRRSA